jgi:20S proteasome alpha/beta subunit
MEDKTVDKKSKEDSREAARPTRGSALAPDIQAIMNVIRRRARSYEQGEREVLDLHEADISGANLTSLLASSLPSTGA